MLINLSLSLTACFLIFFFLIRGVNNKSLLKRFGLVSIAIALLLSVYAIIDQQWQYRALVCQIKDFGIILCVAALIFEDRLKGRHTHD